LPPSPPPRGERAARNESLRKGIAVLALAALVGGQVGGSVASADERDRHDRSTATPIEHVIVIIGENRTFDNLYGTYVPKHGQRVLNLLSQGIVRPDGSPGANMNAAEQFQISTIDPVSYFVSTNALVSPGKAAYATLPTPEAGGAPPQAVTLAQLDKDPAPAAPPFDAQTFSRDQLATLSPEIARHDLLLLTTGATGLKNCTSDPTEPPSACAEPDTRVAGFAQLPNTVFQITGPSLPYDSYTGD